MQAKCPQAICVRLIAASLRRLAAYQLEFKSELVCLAFRNQFDSIAQLLGLRIEGDDFHMDRLILRAEAIQSQPTAAVILLGYLPSVSTVEELVQVPCAAFGDGGFDLPTHFILEDRQVNGAVYTDGLRELGVAHLGEQMY